ncbi:GNAT family N-acetyltransferase [Sporosarcina sp.]|uniref:GNAT family N-acetyltransferase n=1 Tax=Sporosarcina sp. TaxID=49982 RepID=UPI00260F909F|nr:GNAT family N-acetyltransferase [Sporosarcina sp.]
MNIRIANGNDVRSIAQVQVESWRTTYRGIVPQAYLDELSVENRMIVWKKVTEIHSVFVAENAVGDIIGFAAGGEERTKEYPSYTGELYAVYLLEECQKQGVGRRLFDHVVSVLKQGGHQSMLIWALTENPACRFYEKMGGVIVDRTIDEIGGKQLEETAFGWMI